MSSQSFKLIAPDIAPAEGRITLNYEGTDGTRFAEELHFAPFAGLSAERTAALPCAVRLAHLLAATSYYKLDYGAPIDHALYALSASEAALLNDVYSVGLSEFIFVNGLDPADAPRFEASGDAPAPAALGRSAPKALVPIGGGKDSVVALEAVRALKPVTGFYVGKSAVVEEVARAGDVVLTTVRRTLSEALFEKNAAGGLNGHVPVTAINSAIAVIAAVIGGYDEIVFANERSANVGNTVDGDGFEINHQWSKSFAFEEAFRRVVHESVTPDIDYYSALRELSEVSIARIFAHLERYHRVITSCNRAFRILKEKPGRKWCGECEKCRFVFLILSLDLPVSYLEHILGFNALKDLSAVPVYLSLLGMPGTRKPLECVGEDSEVQYVFQRLMRAEDTKDLPVVREIAAQLERDYPLALADKGDGVLAPIGPSFVPPELAAELEALSHG